MAEIKGTILGKKVTAKPRGKKIDLEVEPFEGVTIKQRINLQDVFKKGWEGLSESQLELRVKKQFKLPNNAIVDISGNLKKGGGGSIFANISMPFNKGGSVKKYAKGGGIRKVRYV